MNIFEKLEALDRATDEDREASKALWDAIQNNAPLSEIARLQEISNQKREASRELSDSVMNYIRDIEWLRRQNND